VAEPSEHTRASYTLTSGDLSEDIQLNPAFRQVWLVCYRCGCAYRWFHETTRCVDAQCDGRVSTIVDQQAAEAAYLVGGDVAVWALVAPVPW
jgi:hypothetical protein